MGKHSHTFVGRLQAAKEIIKISKKEVTRGVQDMSSFKSLSFFDLYTIPVEELPNQKQNLKWRAGDLKNNIWEEVCKAKVNETLEEKLSKIKVTLN